jgi:hypothetical protein
MRRGDKEKNEIRYVSCWFMIRVEWGGAERVKVYILYRDTRRRMAPVQNSKYKVANYIERRVSVKIETNFIKFIHYNCT